jgi:hypothetical protein
VKDKIAEFQLNFQDFIEISNTLKTPTYIINQQPLKATTTIKKTKSKAVLQHESEKVFGAQKMKFSLSPYFKTGVPLQSIAKNYNQSQQKERRTSK